MIVTKYDCLREKPYSNRFCCYILAIMQYLIGHPRWPRDGRNDDPIAFCICRYIDLLTAHHIFSLRLGFSGTKSLILGWPLKTDRSTLSVFCCSQFISLLVIIFVGKENGDKDKNILYLIILHRLKRHFKIFRNKKCNELKPNCSLIL